MSDGAKSESVKKLKTFRLFPGKTLKGIIQRTRNATRLTEFFLRSADYESFIYTYKDLEN